MGEKNNNFLFLRSGSNCVQRLKRIDTFFLVSKIIYLEIDKTLEGVDYILLTPLDRVNYILLITLSSHFRVESILVNKQIFGPTTKLILDILVFCLANIFWPYLHQTNGQKSKLPLN